MPCTGWIMSPVQHTFVAVRLLPPVFVAAQRNQTTLQQVPFIKCTVVPPRSLPPNTRALENSQAAKSFHGSLLRCSYQFL